MEEKNKTVAEVHAEIVVNLTIEDVDDIMVSALEGGINYWCYEAVVVGEYLASYASEQIARGGKVKLYDSESDDVWELDMEKFAQGVRLWLENGDDRYGAVKGGKIDPGLVDGEMADLIIQYALFGEVVFG